jgi:hypothetical protein
MVRKKTILSHKDWLQIEQKIRPNTVPIKYHSTKVQDLANYLGSLDWDFFMTGSTGYELTLKSARRLADRYSNNLPTGSLFFWVAERFECKDGYHIHGLVQLPESNLKYDNRSKWLMGQYWQLATGNKCIQNDNDGIRWEIWNQIDNSPYMKGLGAHGYCAKYINKKKADYDMLVTKASNVDN